MKIKHNIGSEEVRFSIVSIRMIKILSFNENCLSASFTLYLDKNLE